MAALEEALKQGPVHIIKNNKPACVVLSETDYTALVQKQETASNSLWDLLDNKAWKKIRSKKILTNKFKKNVIIGISNEIMKLFLDAYAIIYFVEMSEPIKIFQTNFIIFAKNIKMPPLLHHN